LVSILGDEGHCELATAHRREVHEPRQEDEQVRGLSGAQGRSLQEQLGVTRPAGRRQDLRGILVVVVEV
jgi:hypothetical protein